MADPEEERTNEQPVLLTLKPLLVSAQRAAWMLGISERTLRKLDSIELLPKSVEIGRRRLWRVSELEEWVAAGCPGRERWELSKREAERRPASR